jgi:flagellar motility protein MotE (MotC chaperone)
LLKLVAFALFLSAGGPGHKDPTPPTPPTAPQGPKAPEAPAASAKGDGHGHKAEAGKGEATKTEAGKGPAEKGEKTAAKGAKTDKTDKAEKSDKGEAEEKGGEASAARAGKGERRSSSRGERPGPTPPSLTGMALRHEAGKSAEERGTAPMSERQRLEQLASEINKAREALKQDTARLEAMLRGGAAGDGRLPVGDPTTAMPAGVAPGAAASKEAMKEQILTVSKAMKGMKPEQAAAIIARLDRVLGAEILRRMKPTDAGAVMGVIKPEVAAELATLIATRKSLIEGDKKEASK